jgi:putative hydroxymethylpyrimidine transport system substrate-binding protein
MRDRRRSLVVAGLALAALAVAACGGGGNGGAPPTVVVSLDFTPNAVHAPIYTAVREGRDRAGRMLCFGAAVVQPGGGGLDDYQGQEPASGSGT